jgi:hypothetical protein
MLGFEISRAAAIILLGYMAAFGWAWHRAEKLRHVPGTEDALPTSTAFFTGAAFLWLWGDGRRRLNDRQLSLAVWLARACFASGVLLLAGSVFLYR